MSPSPRASVAAGLVAALIAGLPVAAAAAPTDAPVSPGSPSTSVSFTPKRTGTRAVARRPLTETPTRPAPTPAAGPLLRFSPSSFFYDDISKAPLDPNSGAIAANVARQVADHWGGVAAFNAHAWNTTYYRVDAKTPRVNVKWSNCLGFTWTPDGLFTGDKVFMDVPIPKNATAAVGSDASMTIYDPATDTAWEFWQMGKDASGSWRSCQGGRINNVSTAMGQFPLGFGVSATGLSLGGGAISAAEAKAGRIEHAMYLAVMEARYFDQCSWPAVRSDGYTKDPTTPLEGQRLRLDPTVNVDALNMSPFAKAVARAAQKYGFIVSDKGGAVALIGEDGQSLKATTGADPWRDILGGEDYEALRGFPWHRIQALPKDYGKR